MSGSIVSALLVQVLLLEGLFDLLPDVVLLLLQSSEFGCDPRLNVRIEGGLPFRGRIRGGGSRGGVGGEMGDEGFGELGGKAD